MCAHQGCHRVYCMHVCAVVVNYIRIVSQSLIQWTNRPVCPTLGQIKPIRLPLEFQIFTWICPLVGCVGFNQNANVPSRLFPVTGFDGEWVSQWIRSGVNERGWVGISLLNAISTSKSTFTHSLSFFLFLMDFVLIPSFSFNNNNNSNTVNKRPSFEIKYWSQSKTVYLRCLRAIRSSSSSSLWIRIEVIPCMGPNI